MLLVFSVKGSLKVMLQPSSAGLLTLSQLSSCLSSIRRDGKFLDTPHWVWRQLGMTVAELPQIDGTDCWPKSAFFYLTAALYHQHKKALPPNQAPPSWRRVVLYNPLTNLGALSFPASPWYLLPCSSHVLWMTPMECKNLFASDHSFS